MFLESVSVMSPGTWRISRKHFPDSGRNSSPMILCLSLLEGYAAYYVACECYVMLNKNESLRKKEYGAVWTAQWDPVSV